MKGAITNSLCSLRKKHGFTQKDIAEIASITSNYYQMIEYGKKAPTVYIALRLAKALGTTVEELFTE